MDFIDKIGRSLGLSDEEKIEEPKETEPPKIVSQIETVESSEPEHAPKNVFDFNSAAAFSREHNSERTEHYNASEIKTIKPKNFNDAQTVSNLLRDKIAVIVNVEETDSLEAQRIIDFIGGTIYAVDGKIRPISQKVFICAPKNVKVESYEDEKKSKGNFFD